MGSSWTPTCDRGDVLVDGLVKAVGYLAVVALLCFEIVAVGVNIVQLDDLAGDVARGAAGTLPATADTTILQAVAEQHIRGALTARPEVLVQDVGVDAAGEVRVTLARAPRTAVLRHVPPLAARLPQTVTATGRPPRL